MGWRWNGRERLGRCATAGPRFVSMARHPISPPMPNFRVRTHSLSRCAAHAEAHAHVRTHERRCDEAHWGDAGLASAGAFMQRIRLGHGVWRNSVPDTRYVVRWKAPHLLPNRLPRQPSPTLVRSLRRSGGRPRTLSGLPLSAAKFAWLHQRRVCGDEEGAVGPE